MDDESLDGECGTVSFPCEAVGEVTAEEGLDDYGGYYFHEFGMGGLVFEIDIIAVVIVDGLNIGMYY